MILEGQAGDEVFCGYDHVQPGFFFELLRSGRPRYAFAQLEARRRARGLGRIRTGSDLAKQLLPVHVRGRRAPAWLARSVAVPPRVVAGRRLRDHHLHLLTVSPLPSYLHHDDRNSMSLGIESRSPFFDHRLAEAALGLPADVLLRNGLQKWVLREAMRGIVPDEIVDRPEKQGFTVDQATWFRGELGDVLRSTLTSRQARSRPYFDPARLADLASRAGGAADAGLWRAFVVERWLRLFIDPSLIVPPEGVSAGAGRPRAHDRLVRLAAHVPTDHARAEPISP